MSATPRKETLLDRLRAELKAVEEGIDGLEARTFGSALEEVSALRAKKDEFGRELDEVEQAGDEAWESLMEGLRLKMSALRSSFERLFSKHRP